MTALRAGQVGLSQLGPFLTLMIWNLRAWLHDDVEVGVAEWDGDAPLRGDLRIGDLLEVFDEGLLYCEYRVGFDVLAVGDEDVRGQRPVPGRGDDEVDVRGAERVPPGRLQQLACRAVGRDRVIARHDRAEPELALLIGREEPAAVRARLRVRLLHVVEPLVIGLPHVERGAWLRRAVHRVHTPGA